MGASKDNLRLIRQFYQSIPTPEEKAAFQAVMAGSKEDRIAYLGEIVGKTMLDPATVQAILTVTTLTKQDRIQIFAGAFRAWLFGLFGI